MMQPSDIQYDFQFNSTNLTYSFDIGGSVWNGQYDLNDVIEQTFTESSKTNLTGQSLFTNALNMWDAYSVFNFTALSNGVADIYTYNTNNSGVATTGFFESDVQSIAAFPEGSGDPYTRAEIAFGSSGVTNSGLGHWSALHEIGHALGLRGDGAISSTYTTDMTVMSYSIAGSGNRYAITPMAYDILALTEKYGSFSYNPRQTYGTETFDGTNRSQTIVDTGSTADTFDLSSVSGTHYINLNQTIDSSKQWVEDAHSVINGQEYVYIAYGTKIENAKGGSQSDSVQGDTIIGNGLTNELEGFGGKDSLFGHGGSDLLTGGTGDDSLYGGSGDDFLYGGANDDNLYGESNADHLFGDSGDDKLYGGSGNDTLSGGSGNDRFIFLDAFDHDTVSQGGSSNTGDRIQIGTASVVEGVATDVDGSGSYRFNGYLLEEEAGGLKITSGVNSVFLQDWDEDAPLQLPLLVALANSHIVPQTSPTLY